MYISATDKAAPKRPRSKRALTSSGRYLLAAAACMAAGVIYEYFSHDVWSVYMLFAFAVPLFAGAIPAFLAWLFRLPGPAPAAEAVYACGIITLTAGCFLKGSLEIYGTTNSMLICYFIAGAALITAGAVLYLIGLKTVKTG